MSLRRKRPVPPPDDPPTPAAEEVAIAEAEDVAVVEAEDEDDADDEDDTDDAVVVVPDEIVVVDDDLVDDLVEVVKPAVAARPPGRPSPGRPPGAKEEPDPPFLVGERIRLIQNTRPRTGTPIGDYPTGAEGRVETVLSLTSIVRFDMAPDTKEVVAFQCVESIDPEAQAQRAARDAARSAAEAAAEQGLTG